MNKPRYIRTEDTHVPLREFHFYDGNNTPSWERPGQSRSGRASLDVRTHMENPYLSFVASESGDRSNRQVMISLNADEGRQFFNWLKSIYEP